MASASSPEFQLMCACCRWPASPDRDAAIRALARSPIDWEKFADIVEHHRVDGLVAAALNSAEAERPQATRDRFDAAARRIAHQNLLLAAETIRMAQLFAAAGVRFVFLKGATLAMLAYGSLGMKRAMDIDVLIAPEDFALAVGVLRDASYRPEPKLASLTPEELARWAAAYKETGWRGRNSIALDLHTNLVNNPLLIAAVDASSPRQMVLLGEARPVPTLATEPLFAFLCAHGALHKWARLKWLADVAALLAGLGESGIEELHEAALRLGAGRTGGLALLLCAELFATPVSERLLTTLSKQRAMQRLRRVTLREMERTARHGVGRAVLSNLPGIFAELLFLPSARYKVLVLRDLLADPLHIATNRIPGPFAGVLYPMLGALDKAQDKMRYLLSPNKRW